MPAISISILTPVPEHVGVSTSNFNAACKDNIGQTRAVTKKKNNPPICVCIYIHQRVCLCLEVRAQNSTVCLNKQMDEKLHLSLFKHLYLFFHTWRVAVQALLDLQRRVYDCNTRPKSDYVHCLLLEYLKFACPMFRNCISCNIYHWLCYVVLDNTYLK